MSRVVKAQYVVREKDGSFNVIGWDIDNVQKQEGVRLTNRNYLILSNEITGWADMTHLIEHDGAWYLAIIE